MGVNGKHEVVYFFNKQGVDKEMLFTEFESLLDSMIPAPELAKKTIEAAYVNLDAALNITSIVFFLVSFDTHGNVDSKWNVPLRKLATKGVTGPDLGGGPCKIYMLGMNEIADYQNYLWDPDERNGANDLIHVRSATRANRLCLSKEEEDEWMGDASMVMRDETQYAKAPPVAAVAKAVTLELPAEDPVSNSSLLNDGGDEFSQAIKIIETQRIRIAALENAVRSGKGGVASKDDLAKLQKEIDTLQTQKKTLEAQVKEAQKKAETLEKELKKSGDALEKTEKQAKENLTKLKQKLEKEAATSLEKQKVSFEKQQAELKKQVEKEKQEFEQKTQDSLDETRKELVEEYKQKDQQIETLKKELTELRGDKFRLMKGGAEEFFQKLAAADISFMSFKPGAGHMTIPLNEIANFIESPNAFSAKKCNISLEAYETWLEHYNKPICTAPLPGDKVCGEKIIRTDIPANYRANVSNRCKKHGGK